MANEKLNKVSTNEVAISGFAPHGVMELFLERDVLHYECTGPFNREAFDAMAVATACVTGHDVEGGSIMGPYFAKNYAEIGRPFKIFPTLDEAIHWAQAMVDASR
jgi:hypothetical protein